MGKIGRDSRGREFRPWKIASWQQSFTCFLKSQRCKTPMIATPSVKPLKWERNLSNRILGDTHTSWERPQRSLVRSKRRDEVQYFILPPCSPFGLILVKYVVVPQYHSSHRLRDDYCWIVLDVTETNSLSDLSIATFYALKRKDAIYKCLLILLVFRKVIESPENMIYKCKEVPSIDKSYARLHDVNSDII